MNKEDLVALGSIPNLEELDLNDVTFTKENSKDIFFISSRGYFSFPTLLPKLTTLKISHSIKINENLPKIKCLTVPYSISIFGAEDIHWQKVTLVGNAQQTELQFEPYSSKFGLRSKNNKCVIDTLVVSSLSVLPHTYTWDIEYVGCKTTQIIIEQNTNKHILNHWVGNLDINLIEDIDELMPSAFAYTNLTHIDIPSKVKVIPQECFYGSSKLSTVNLNNARVIEPNAFTQTRVKSLTLCKDFSLLYESSFENSPLQELTMLGKQAPTLKMSMNSTATGNCNLFSDVIIKVPQNCYDSYHKVFRASEIEEEGVELLSLDITLTEPGTIMSQIKREMFNRISSLTITGVLYETDMSVIGSFSRLKYLDLSRAYPTYSPEKRKEIEAEGLALNAIFSMISDQSQQKYKKREISTEENNYVQVVSKLVLEANQDSKNEIYSLIPRGFCAGLKSLETVKLPSHIAVMFADAFSGCSKLTDINIPQYINEIRSGVLSGTKLRKVVFPESLYRVDYNEPPFSNCPELEELDFSKCQFRDQRWKITFTNCPNLKIVRIAGNTNSLIRNPIEDKYQSKSEIFFNASIGYIERSMYNQTIHFTGKKPPVNSFGSAHYSIENCIIFIPEGTMTSYHSLDYSNMILEE